jgi:uncharacterized protein (DUF1697 family)
VNGRHVALLRGINVGRAKRIAMADLRELFEALGLTDVRTLLNSGNVVFRAGARPVSDAAIERALEKRLGVSSRVTVLTAAELASVVRENPLLQVARHPSRLLVTFLRDRGDRKRLAPLAQRLWVGESFAIGTRVAYLWCPGGSIDSPLNQTVNRLLGDAATTRNWATVTKLHVLAEVPGS